MVSLKMKQRNVQIIGAIILIAVILTSGGEALTIFNTGSLGYSTGFQNPRASFAGVKCDSTKTTVVGTTLSFDADEWNRGKPNIVGEMTSVFVPEESLSAFASWVPTDWLKQNSYIKNPQREYSWNISGKTYKMEQWVLKFYMSFSGEWDGMSESGGDNNVNVMWAGQAWRNYYTNTEVWLEFDLTPTWYIQGGGTAYFSIGKMQVSNDVKKSAQDINGKEYEKDTQLSVSPESSGAISYIYYGLWGTGSAEQESSYYQGKLLNPALFKNKVYTKFTFNNFGLTSWNEFPAVVKTKGDVVTIGFDITVFVIGEWDVKDIQSIPEDFGRSVKTFTQPSLFDYLSDPRMQALISLLVMAGILVLILLFAPWVLIAIIAMFRGGSKRR